MPAHRRSLISDIRWKSLVDRAHGFEASIPPEGVHRGIYVDAVLNDVDPAYTEEYLRRLQAEGIVWVRRLRGDARVYVHRPASIAMPKGVAASPEARLCCSVAGHMLALGRAETARRGAREAGDEPAAWRCADDVALHAVRALGIIRQHLARGAQLDAVRSALGDAFAEPALSALIRRDDRLSPKSTADALNDPQPLPKPKRIARGLPTDMRVLALIEGSGADGMTRTDLAAAIRPKPSADALSALLAALSADRLIEERAGRSGGRGRPAQRYHAVGGCQSRAGAETSA